MRAWGVDPEQAAKLMEDVGDPVFEVDPENWDAVVLFMRSQTQWTISATGHRSGLNYVGVEVVARLARLDLTQELFDQVQLLELTVINELSKRAAHGKTPSRSRHRG